MKHSAEFRRLLEDRDVARLRSAYAQIMPHLPQPKDDAQAEVIMHLARTTAQIVEAIPFAKVAYSHRWLVERGLPSQLPDKLKPKAERLYPKIVHAVGIAVGSSSAHMKPAADMIRKAMEDAVSDCYANGDTDPAFVKLRLMAARTDEQKRLFGSLTPRS